LGDCVFAGDDLTNMNHAVQHKELPFKNKKKEQFAIVIPAYNHHQKIRDVIIAAMALDLPIFVIDDGSSDLTFENIKNIPDIHIIRHKKNLGKGAAIMTGFTEAVRYADWAITIDADGQHAPEDAVKLMKAAIASPDAVIIGMRMGMDGAHIHWTSRYGRHFSNFWVWISGGAMLSDSQSGFRIYPLPEAMNLNVKSNRFEFEVEILVLANRHGIPVIEVPVNVNYDPAGERVSHFRPWKDFLRNSRVFSRLIVERIFNLN
jgi:glycosyltransferase involved in cell wall biosynthesis